MTNNEAETYISIVAQFVGGKRINFEIKEDYGVPCTQMAISFNKKRNIFLLCIKSYLKVFMGFTQKYLLLK